jgi:hypothetical protein
VIDSKTLGAPTYQKAALAELYVRAADDFLAQDRLGEASRAYWAAISVTKLALASRPDREAIRRQAYDGLARCAAVRQQREWQSVLIACSTLASTYLSTPDAGRDRETFEHARASINKALQVAAKERSSRMSAEAALSRKQLAVVATGAFESTTNAEAWSQNLAVAQDLRAQREALSGTEGTTGSYLATIRRADAELRDITAEDVSGSDEGGSVLAADAVVYIANATDPVPYLDAIRQFGGHRQDLRVALDQYSAAPSKEALITLGRALQRWEIEAAIDRHPATTP